MQQFKTVILVIALLVVGFFLLPFVKTNPPKQPAQNSKTEQNQTNDLLAGKKPGTKLYVSEKLGVKFTYDPKPIEDLEVAVTEKDNKIYVHPANQDPTAGQVVEVFSKDPDLSLTDAIKKQFLQNYNEKDCFVKSYSDAPELPQGYDAAGISYPPPPDPNQPFYLNADKCPKDYAETNALRYFFSNKSIKNKYIFVRAGQDAITSDGTLDSNGAPKYNWTYSIQIF